MITPQEARAAIAAAVVALPSEEVALSEATGRRLARDIAADVDWPPFDASAMDGWAMHRADLEDGSAKLAPRPGILAAGSPPAFPLSPGETLKIMTGAVVPKATAAVAPVEDAREEKGRIVVERIPAAGAHIRRRGEVFRAGAALLSQGTRLTAGAVTLAALAGADPIAVHRRPRILVAATGNELVPASGRPGEAQLRDTNGPMLVALCAARGWSARVAPRAADDENEIARLFRSASKADVLLTTGGVSAGDFDLVPEVARRCGFEILFHRVAMRPGKPIAFGKRRSTYWIGLPGNPVSASAGFHLFAREVLDRLEGASDPGAPRLQAQVTKDLVSGGRETYMDARLSFVEGVAHAEPLSSRGSHDLSSHARANALIRVPPGARLPQGSLAECILLES
ncbi:MAG TPA: gephyrin-like molybdotransferase Glp [Thermoanaerobaculia bacterium]|jgi:molybdopterin molybdotransferase